MALNLKHPAIELLYTKLSELSWLNDWHDIEEIPNLSYYLSLMANELNVPDGDYIEFLDGILKDAQFDVEETMEEYTEVAKKVYQIYDENRQIRISLSELKKFLEMASNRETTAEEIYQQIAKAHPVNK